MAQSKAKFNKIPEVEFNLSTVGITIICPRLPTPRFLQYDIKGKCNTCKSDSAEIDFLVTIDGITIYCNRLQKPKFVPFDYKYDSFAQQCLFRVKTKGKIFNIPYDDKLAKLGIIDNIHNYDVDDEVPTKKQKMSE